MQEMEKVFEQVDLYVGGNDLVITNLTGHPTVVLPNGFRQRDDLQLPTRLPSPASCLMKVGYWPWPMPTSKPRDTTCKGPR